MTVNALRTPQIEPVHTLVANAPAKINLTLDILERREDGFHELRSLAIGVGLTDRIRCRATPDPGVRVDCSDASLASKDNLAAQAVQRLAKREGINAAIRIEIEKRIPVAAGLGGGSSDAATTLHSAINSGTPGSTRRRWWKSALRSGRTSRSSSTYPQRS